MAGSLSFPNKVKDVYKNLVFLKDGRYYRDDGTQDVELVIGGGHTGINNDLSWLKFTTTSTVSSGKLFEIENDSTSIFSLDVNGTLKLKSQSSAPTASTGALYFNGTSLHLGV